MNEPVIRYNAEQIKAAILRACQALEDAESLLTSLDQAMGDGDLGITATKTASALRAYLTSTELTDVGKFLVGAGIAVNREASSTMGTLIATALMRAGKEARELSELTPADLSRMLSAAASGIQERGKAQLGDKTVLDALYPAAETLSDSLTAGLPLAEALARMLKTAEGGRDRVTPLQSRIGRGSWVGERTVGLVDPGCELCVVVLKALVG